MRPLHPSLLAAVAALALTSAARADDPPPLKKGEKIVFLGDSITQGGVGPKLAGVVTGAFPDAQQEIAVVRDGLAGMPSFKNKLSAAQIQDVVAYTRSQLK